MVVGEQADKIVDQKRAWKCRKWWEILALKGCGYDMSGYSKVTICMQVHIMYGMALAVCV